MKVRLHETIVFDPILDPYWETNTVEGIKVFTDAIDVIKDNIQSKPTIGGGTLNIETVANGNHNDIYRRVELADNEQLITGDKTSYSGRASKFSRAFDLDLPVDGNLAVLNETIGIAIVVLHNLMKGTGAVADTITGYNVGDNECDILIASSNRLISADITGNDGGAGITIARDAANEVGTVFANSIWNAELLDCGAPATFNAKTITTNNDQRYRENTALGGTTLQSANGDITFDKVSQGTEATISLDTGTLTTTGAATFIAGSSTSVDTVAMGSTYLLNDSTMVTNFITGGALTMANNSRLEIFNDSTLSGTMDDSTIITDGDLTLTGATTNMTITGFGGDEDVNLGGVADGDTIANVADVTYDADAHVTDNTITASGTITLPNEVTGPLGSNSTFTANTISQPQTAGNKIDRCNLIADSVTVVNATDCIMDGTTTNIVVGNSLRNLWLHNGRVNPGAGVTTPTGSTEDTITVNGVDLRLTGADITSLGVGSGIRAGYIATLT